MKLALKAYASLFFILIVLLRQLGPGYWDEGMMALTILQSVIVKFVAAAAVVVVTRIQESKNSYGNSLCLSCREHQYCSIIEVLLSVSIFFIVHNAEREANPEDSNL